MKYKVVSHFERRAHREGINVRRKPYSKWPDRKDTAQGAPFAGDSLDWAVGIAGARSGAGEAKCACVHRYVSANI